MTPSTGTTASRLQLRGRAELWLAIWVVAMLVVPIMGTFYPPETYFFAGAFNEQEFSSSKLMPVLLVLISASVGVVYVALRRRTKIRHDIAIYVYLLAVALSLAYSPEPGAAANRALRLLPPIGLAVLYAQLYPYRAMIRLMAIAFTISALLSIVMGAAFPGLGHSNLGGMYDSAWRGALGHKNTAGFVYSLGLLTATVGWLDRLIDRRLAVVCGLTCAFMIVMADSMTAVLAVSAALGLTLLLRGARIMRPEIRLLVVGIIVFALISLTMLVQAAPELIAAMIGRDLTLTGRTEVWSAVWDLIQKRPLGSYGYAFWQMDTPEREGIWTEVGYMALHTHNNWLDLWLQVGLLGLLAIAFDLLRSLATGFRDLLFDPRAAQASLPFAFLVVLIIRSMSEVEFEEPGTTGVFLLVWASIALRVGRLERRATRPAPRQPAPIAARRTMEAATLRS
ncbi:O-antigen ligase family protein [Sphingomonas morindae]|uniref:O-antigen ligase family protein n=1 Tax=Sphingomonas morindae TaxID=1541170 RepID=A0ABY4X6C6_9SPHN|nr:O-antigen ligase family protein [Sphingomonas morindae]USI72463.1 O-antigen ligase family protein [Sphingomonas morindae]